MADIKVGEVVRAFGNWFQAGRYRHYLNISYLAQVVEVDGREAKTAVIRRMGKTTNGRKHPTHSRPLVDLIPTQYDPMSANIYADWLEEKGFTDASKALRRSFGG